MKNKKNRLINALDAVSNFIAPIRAVVPDLPLWLAIAALLVALIK